MLLSRPGWSCLHWHYPDLLVNDVLMVLPKETMRHFLASLSRCTDVAQNDETKVRPFHCLDKGMKAHMCMPSKRSMNWLTLDVHF